MDGWVYGYGSFHWFWFILMAAVVLYPVGRILSRMGFSPLWSILLFFPVLNLIALWILAFTDGRAERVVPRQCEPWSATYIG